MLKLLTSTTEPNKQTDKLTPDTSDTKLSWFIDHLFAFWTADDVKTFNQSRQLSVSRLIDAALQGLH